MLFRHPIIDKYTFPDYLIKSFHLRSSRIAGVERAEEDSRLKR